MFSTSVSPSKCATDPAFDVGTLVGVSDREHVRGGVGLQGRAIDGHEADLVAESG